MMRATLLAALLFTTPPLAGSGDHKAKPLDVGDRLELMVDDYLIDSMTGDVQESPPLVVILMTCPTSFLESLPVMSK